MRADVYPTAVNIPPAAELAGRVAVVIDVLRATSTICTALANGAATVVPVLTPEEAFRMARDNPDRDFLLGGERHAVLIPGFHCGNSPLEYTEGRVKGRPILFTTTNGTRAIRGAAAADRVYIASLLNAPAIGRELVRLGRDVAICCAGTHDQFSLEDTACAGAILEFMTRSGWPVETNDLGLVARELFRQFEGRLVDLMRLSAHGQNLVRLGMQDDLDYCAQLGTLTVLPVLRDGQIVPLR